MGWLKKATKFIDKLRPEWVKEATDKLMPEKFKEMSIKLGTDPSFFPGGSSSSSGAPAAVAPETPIMSLGETEAQELASKRLARMGKYFTSPTGVLGNANTASAKTFS